MKKRTTKKATARKMKKPKVAKRRAGTKAKKARAGANKSRNRKTANRAGTRSGARTSRKRPDEHARRTGRPAPGTARTAKPEAGIVVGAWSRVAPHVAEQLRARGWDNPDPDVVGAIAAVAAGYREGPASDPPFPTAFDGDGAVADAFVGFYSMGARSPGPDRRSRLPIVRQTVSFNLRQLGVAASSVVRDTLAWIALGIWRPGLDEIAKLNGLASFLVPWYRAGLA